MSQSQRGGVPPVQVSHNENQSRGSGAMDGTKEEMFHRSDQQELVELVIVSRSIHSGRKTKARENGDGV